MAGKNLTWQVKYGKKDIKFVDISKLVDFSGEAEATQEQEAKVSFKNPFDVPDDYDYEPEKDKKYKTTAELDMDELIRGIEEFGVLVPLIVRKSKGDKNKYELLSGYRRKKAVEIINKRRSKEDKIKVPVIIVPECDDTRATLILTTSNAHRSKISLREQIRACGLTYREMRKAEPQKNKKEIVKTVAELFKVSEDDVPRYSMLVNLNNGLLDLITGEDKSKNRTRKRSETKDGKIGKVRLSRRAGVFLATLNEDQQKLLLEVLEDNKDIAISVKMASDIRKKFKDKPNLTADELLYYIKGDNEGQSTENNLEVEQIGFDNLQSYFKDEMPHEIRDKVQSLFTKWREAGSPENFEIKSTEQTQPAVKGYSDV